MMVILSVQVPFALYTFFPFDSFFWGLGRKDGEQIPWLTAEGPVTYLWKGDGVRCLHQGLSADCSPGVLLKQLAWLPFLCVVMSLSHCKAL